MEYRIQAGDTIATVTQRLGTDWNTLKNANPAAVGKSKKTGDWIVKAGKTVSVPSSFQEILAQQTAQQAPPNSSPKKASQQQTTASQSKIVHVVKKGENLWDLASKRYKVAQTDIRRLNKINNPKMLKVGQQIRIPNTEKSAENNADAKVVASWYGKQHQGRIMANGSPYDMYGATIAHRDIAIGTTVELENPKTGEKVKAVVTDRGPYASNRDVDLSYGLAKRLSLARQGVGNLKMRVL